MPWGYAIAAVATYAGSENQKSGAKDAAKASAAGSQAAIDEQRREYDQSRADQAPWMQAGSGALAQMQALNNGDFSSFHASPDYDFTFGQGLSALDKSAASRGGLFGGGHSMDLTKYGQGMAEQQYGNFYNRLSTMAGQGQATASGLGNLGANMANQIGAQYNSMGNARASSYINQANANSNMYNSFGQLAGNYFGNRNGQSSGSGWGWGGV